ncbi:PAS domain-containing protein [Sorangium sp. So ce1036]|uniref:STAS domain-containing protein n=1 Tax=Sorangium sp. So ce1036 TaxID=3133328 RepID=UPI003F0EE3E4
MTIDLDERRPSAGVDPLPLLRALPTAAAIFDANGALLCANPRLEQLLAEGALPAWPVSLPRAPAVQPASPDGLARGAQGVLAGLLAVLRGERDQVDIELPGGAPGGPRREIAITPLGVDGARGALVCVRPLAAPCDEQEPAPVEGFLDTIIDHLPVTVLIKEVKELRLVRVNRHYEELIGMSRAALLGKSAHDLFKQRHEADLVDRMDREVIEKGEISIDPEMHITGPAQEELVLRTVKMPLKDAQGVPRYLLSIFEDITEKKRAEEAQQRELAWFETQRELRAVIQELSTPVIPVHEGILVMPLVGSIDSSRGAQLLETLLRGVERHQAGTVLIDITGVPVMDAEVAARLLQATRAAALLGATSVLVGASPEVARTLVAQGIDLGNLPTQRDLQAGILYALARQGKAIVEQRRALR